MNRINFHPLLCTCVKAFPTDDTFGCYGEIEKFYRFVVSGAQVCVLAFSTVDRASFEAVESWKSKVVN